MNGKIHRYNPDFKVGEEYWEVKGNQFLKNDGTWINPFSEIDNGINEAKRQVCIKNNIKILYETDINLFKEYFMNVYGKKFLKSLITGKNI